MSDLLDRCIEIERKHHAAHRETEEWMGCLPCLRDIIAELQKKCRAADELAEFYGNPLNYHLGSSVLGNQRPVKDISKTEWVDPDSGLDFSGMVGGYRARQFQKDYPKTGVL